MLAPLLALLTGSLLPLAVVAPAPQADGPPAPGVSAGTWLGGSFSDRAFATARCPDGGLVLVGTTSSDDFPATPGAVQPQRRGLTDAFVAKLSARGALEWATYLGGLDNSPFLMEAARDVAVDADGSVVVCGLTVGGGFPSTAGSAQPQRPGALDAFVARFSPGGALLWATYVGGSEDDDAAALALDPQGRVVVAGHTFSGDFPATPGAFDETENSLNFLFDDVWVARLAADGSAFDFATYAGGLLRDEATDLALAPDGSIYVAGLTGSADFPVTPGAYDTTYNGASGSKTDAFLLRLAADGASLHWSSFFGAAEIVEGHAVALDGAGRPVLAGLTRDPSLPVTAGAFQPTFGGGTSDGFLAGFSSDGASLRFASFVGGSGADEVRALALTAGDQPTLAGVTDSADFPVRGLQLPGGGARAGAAGGGGFGAPVPGAGPSAPGAVTATPGTAFGGGDDASLGGPRDGFLLRTRRAADALVAARFLGGSDEDRAAALTLEPDGTAWVAGSSSSVDLPMPAGAAQPEPQGTGDAFVLRVALPPVLVPASAAAAPARLLLRGALEPGAPLELSLAGAAPGAAAWLLVRPAAGGAWRVLAPLAVEPDGTARLRGAWPAGVAPAPGWLLEARWRASDGAQRAGPLHLVPR